VQNDIIVLLGINGRNAYRMSFDRPNLRIQVVYKDAVDEPLRHLSTFVKQHATRGACIVYAFKRQDTAEIAAALVKAGVSAAAYHAGLKKDERAQVQASWTSGEVPVVVATIAFGMGIDKSNVRAVVHWTVPKSIEG